MQSLFLSKFFKRQTQGNSKPALLYLQQQAHAEKTKPRHRTPTSEAISDQSHEDQSRVLLKFLAWPQLIQVYRNSEEIELGTETWVCWAKLRDGNYWEKGCDYGGILILI